MCLLRDSAVGLTLFFLLSGCATTIMENTSPQQAVAEVASFETIPASVMIKSAATGDLTHNDVAQVLKDKKVFSKVNTTTAAGEKTDLLLVVSSTSEDDGHGGIEIFYAVLRGLLLSLADSAFADKYDYSVTVDASLQRNGKVVSEYTTTGSYHAECPESEPVAAKTGQVKDAVTKSWGHALELLTAEIQRDREKIVAAMKE